MDKNTDKLNDDRGQKIKHENEMSRRTKKWKCTAGEQSDMDYTETNDNTQRIRSNEKENDDYIFNKNKLNKDKEREREVQSGYPRKQRAMLLGGIRRHQSGISSVQTTNGWIYAHQS